MSEQPFSMGESAVAMHEMFVSLIDAGFTRDESLRVVISILAASAGGQQ